MMKEYEDICPQDIALVHRYLFAKSMYYAAVSSFGIPEKYASEKQEFMSFEDYKKHIATKDTANTIITELKCSTCRYRGSSGGPSSFITCEHHGHNNLGYLSGKIDNYGYPTNCPLEEKGASQ